jgi:hypothetical protein
MAYNRKNKIYCMFSITEIFIEIENVDGTTKNEL